jgi:DNA-binding transcriptional MerR regulator
MPTCVQCPAEAAPGSIRCAPHRDAQRTRDREWRAKRRKANREAGLCAECSVRSTTYYCAACAVRLGRLPITAVDTAVDIGPVYDSDMYRLEQNPGAWSQLMTTQLDRIEAKIAKIELEQREQTALLASIIAGAQLMATNVNDLSAAVDAATTMLADKVAAEGVKLDEANAKLDAEGLVIAETAKRVQDVIDTLRAQGVSQATIDQLTDALSKLSGTSAAIDTATAVIDTSTTALDAHVAALQAIPTTMPTP